MFVGLLQGTSVSSLFKSSCRAREWIVFVLVLLQPSCWETVVWLIALISFSFCFRKMQSSFQRTSSWKSTALLWLIFFYLTFRESLHDNLTSDNKRMKECKMVVLLFCLAGSIWNLQTILSNTSASKTNDTDLFFLHWELMFIFLSALFKKAFFNNGKE